MQLVRPCAALAVALSAALAGCGGTKTEIIHAPSVTVGVSSSAPNAVEQIGPPALATKNTTRIAGADPIADAAGVALAVFPSIGPGTHPAAVTLAPTGDWQAALAASVMMASPIRAPVLLSGSARLPAVTSEALGILSPSGAVGAGGVQVIRVGDVPSVGSMRSVHISAADPYALAAGIDRFQSAAVGKASSDVVIASADQPQYAMPAAGWAAESGDPILFVSSSGVPGPTRQALLSHQRPHIYVLGPASVIPQSVVSQLSKYGTVSRVGADDPAANSVVFAAYRDPACPSNQPCVHVPGSFGWALRSPGHGYVLVNASRTLDAAAAAPLSASGSFGPLLLVEDASSLPRPVLNYFLDYATPGYTQEGPTAAVYNHGWVIGDQSAVSVSVQGQMDTLLEAVPQK
ncbi:MAG TPA: cell wall-binding repeat-containing protein [Candidatus Limnocylindria bacterium]|nr:cell wall-binding repeat-containing protein [Candidatus Limnocylindria bacterium]